MPDVTLTDPLGRAITLHAHTWYGHIIKGHPEVAGHRALVEGAVTAPHEIRYSTSDPDCRVYYGSGPSPGLLVAVVADVVAGFVKTAYLANRMKGVPEWP